MMELTTFMGPGAFFFVFLSIIGFVWFTSQHPIVNLTPATTPKTSSAPYTPPKELPSDTPGIGLELDKIKSELERVRNEVEKAQTLSTRSPAADYVVLNSGSASYEDAAKEYVYFSVSGNAKAQTLITDWQVTSPITGASVTIPQGVYLPFSGQPVNKENIFVAPGDKVIVLTGHSPTGYSFKINKCTGYFEQFQNFTPSLPMSCPQVASEKLPEAPNHLDDTCLDFLERIPRCTVPVGNNVPSTLSPICTSYIAQNVNYATCVKLHKNDPDFYGHEWRVYLNRDQGLWKDRREVIKLLDTNKKTISSVSY